MFLSDSFYHFNPNFGAKKLSLVCPKSKDLVCCFGSNFRVQEFFSGSRFGDIMFLPLALVPFSGCVSFPCSEHRARLRGWGWGAGL